MNGEIKVIKELISECQVIGINQKIKNQTIEYRNRHCLKLPDAIIAASADYFNVPLMTADTSFDKMDDLNIIIYQA